MRLEMDRESADENGESGLVCDTDQALATAMACGNQNALCAFFDRFSPWTYRFAYHHLGRNHTDAEDLWADILTTAMKSIGKYDAARGTLDLWLLGIARFRLARLCRRRKVELPYVPETMDKEVGADEHLIEDIAKTLETREMVNRALATLPERQSTVLIAKYVECYSVDEISRLMGCTPQAVQSLLARAREAFRSAVEAYLGGK